MAGRGVLRGIPAVRPLSIAYAAWVDWRDPVGRMGTTHETCSQVDNHTTTTLSQVRFLDAALVWGIRNSVVEPLTTARSWVRPPPDAPYHKQGQEPPMVMSGLYHA